MIDYKLYIGGIDIKQLGAYITQGTILSFFQFPEFKAYKSNNWHEYNGLEVSVQNLQFKPRTLTLNLYYPAIVNGMFFQQHTYQTLELNIGAIYIQYTKCRFEKVTKQAGDFWTMQIIVDDDPFEILQNNSTILNPVGATSDYAFQLSSQMLNFGAFGVEVLKGTEDSWNAIPSPKKPLIRNIDIFPTALYDNNGFNVTRESKTITFQCLLHKAANMQSWLHNYYAFIYHFTNGLVAIRKGNTLFGGVYQSMQVIEFLPSSPLAWIKFNINFKVTTL